MVIALPWCPLWFFLNFSLEFFLTPSRTNFPPSASYHLPVPMKITQSRAHFGTVPCKDAASDVVLSRHSTHRTHLAQSWGGIPPQRGRVYVNCRLLRRSRRLCRRRRCRPLPREACRVRRLRDPDSRPLPASRQPPARPRAAAADVQRAREWGSRKRDCAAPRQRDLLGRIFAGSSGYGRAGSLSRWGAGVDPRSHSHCPTLSNQLSIIQVLFFNQLSMNPSARRSLT